MSITWSKYFDRIYCINYVEYTKRKQLLQFQLNRVGILNSDIFEWHITFSNILNKKFEKFIQIIQKNENKFDRSLMLGHYNCIRDAYYKGYQRILILEDDVRFLKDLNLIEQILQNRPEDADLILYDKMVGSILKIQQFEPINDYYSSFDSCWSAACYQLNRKGMEKFIHLIENQSNAIDYYFLHKDKYLKDLKCCCTNKNLAIQAIFNTNYSVKNLWDNNYIRLHQFFNITKINYNDYMMRKDGLPYNFGDYLQDD